MPKFNPTSRAIPIPTPQPRTSSGALVRDDPPHVAALRAETPNLFLSNLLSSLEQLEFREVELVGLARAWTAKATSLREKCQQLTEKCRSTEEGVRKARRKVVDLEGELEMERARVEFFKERVRQKLSRNSVASEGAGCSSPERRRIPLPETLASGASQVGRLVGAGEHTGLNGSASICGTATMLYPENEYAKHFGSTRTSGAAAERLRRRDSAGFREVGCSEDEGGYRRAGTGESERWICDGESCGGKVFSREEGDRATSGEGESPREKRCGGTKGWLGPGHDGGRKDVARDGDGGAAAAGRAQLRTSGSREEGVGRGPEATGPFRSLLVERTVALFGTLIGACNSLWRPTES